MKNKSVTLFCQVRKKKQPELASPAAKEKSLIWIVKMAKRSVLFCTHFSFQQNTHSHYSSQLSQV